MRSEQGRSFRHLLGGIAKAASHDAMIEARRVSSGAARILALRDLAVLPQRRRDAGVGLSTRPQHAPTSMRLARLMRSRSNLIAPRGGFRDFASRGHGPFAHKRVRPFCDSGWVARRAI
ncbi:MAG: hypothetical protein WC696_12425 [Candidatus Methylopumilus sp.]